ncbi:MAG: hypothetical protein K2X99_06885 [Gemmatimonadaceae bacterium]|nr:hypothetical protein [Gemmatimonadaceae bacterium]
MSAHPHESDRSAAFTGLILGTVALVAMAWGIVHLTNKKFEGHKAEAASSATK